MNTGSYFEDGKWWLDIDPDDQDYIYADVSRRLTDIGSTAASVTAIVGGGVTIMEAAVVQGTTMVAKTTGFTDNIDNYITFRVTCVNGVRFDKTIWFKRQDG